MFSGDYIGKTVSLLMLVMLVYPLVAYGGEMTEKEAMSKKKLERQLKKKTDNKIKKVYFRDFIGDDDKEFLTVEMKKQKNFYDELIAKFYSIDSGIKKELSIGLSSEVSFDSNDTYIRGTIPFDQQSAIVIVSPSKGAGAFKDYYLVSRHKEGFETVYEKEDLYHGEVELSKDGLLVNELWWLRDQPNDCPGLRVTKKVSFKTGEKQVLETDSTIMDCALREQ